LYAPSNIRFWADVLELMAFAIPRKPALQATDGVLSEEPLAQVAAGLGIIYRANDTLYGTGAQTQPAVFLVLF